MLEASAREQASRELSLPQNRWAHDLISLYFDVKDFAVGTSLSDLTPLARDAFRVIRQASCGTLGNHPLL